MKIPKLKTGSGNKDAASEVSPVPDQLLLSLSMRSVNGKDEIVFPGEVVESLRKAISRLISKTALPHRFSVVSALRQEGVTYLTRAMGMVIANDLNTSVCVVELNWWRPDRSLWIPIENKGLAGILQEEREIEDTLLRFSQPNFAILPAGKLPVGDRPIWARSDCLKEVLLKLGGQFEYLLLDIPAILATNDAVPLASLGDACCVVVNQGVTTVEKVRMALDEIDHLTILGVVLNKTKTATPASILNIIPQDSGLETGESLSA